MFLYTHVCTSFITSHWNGKRMSVHLKFLVKLEKTHSLLGYITRQTHGFWCKTEIGGKKAIINSNGQCACWLIGVVSTAFDSTYDPDSILYACRQPGAKCVRVMRMIFIFYCCSTVGVDKQMYKHPLRKINPTRSSSGSVRKELCGRSFHIWLVEG